MPQGTVAWFDAEKGFGFLTPGDGAPDLFVHISQVEGGQPLAEGQPVTYDVRQTDRGPQAAHVRAEGSVAAPEQPEGGPVVGTVTFFAADKGFGFISLAEGGPDVFVHASAVDGGYALVDGDRVELEVRQGDRGPQAEHVRLLEEGPDEPVGAGSDDVVTLQGTVSWYSAEKGFGFLVPDDLFVHGTAVLGPQLQDGQRVEFEVRRGERGPQAEQVRVVPGSAPDRSRPAPRQPDRPAVRPGGALTGVVAWYAADKGFGFLTPDDGSGDVFVHLKELRDDGVPQEGDRVEFGVVDSPRGRQATGVRRLG